MSDRVRVGVLGGGGILGAHASGLLKAADRCSVVAVAEPDSAKHRRILDLLGDEVEIYGDYEHLLRNADIDAVDILLPHDLHLPATLAAAERGKHVLVEKVMARNIDECDRMIDACATAGVSLTVCHDRRYAAEWIALKNVVDSGLPGQIRYWKLDHNQDVSPMARLPWAASRDRLGGGAIMSCLIHQIDALRWYGGEVAAVMCMTKTVPERMQGETFGVIIAGMRSGALAQLSINWETRQNDGGPNSLWYEMVQVCGERGEAYYMSGRGVFARCHDGSSPGDFVAIESEVGPKGFAKVTLGQRGGHEGCIGEWLNMLLGRPHSVSSSGVDARSTVEVAEAAYRSSEGGSAVSLPIQPVPWKSS